MFDAANNFAVTGGCQSELTASKKPGGDQKLSITRRAGCVLPTSSCYASAAALHRASAMAGPDSMRRCRSQGGEYRDMSKEAGMTASSSADAGSNGPRASSAFEVQASINVGLPTIDVFVRWLISLSGPEWLEKAGSLSGKRPATPRHLAPQSMDSWLVQPGSAQNGLKAAQTRWPRNPPVARQRSR